VADWHDHKDGVSGALLCLGGMLFEWGLPLDKAILGLTTAYAMEASKQEYACTCATPRDKELCKFKDRCREVAAFASGSHDIRLP
jgi:hypothetical protein